MKTYVPIKLNNNTRHQKLRRLKKYAKRSFVLTKISWTTNKGDMAGVSEIGVNVDCPLPLSISATFVKLRKSATQINILSYMFACPPHKDKSIRRKINTHNE